MMDAPISVTTYKILIFSKRRPDMSVAAFRDYYETRHAPLCAKYSTAVSRYLRRYIEPQNHPETGCAGELPFDAITELWFEDEATYRATLGFITTAIMPDDVIADEQQLFDRTAFRIATVIEHETDFGRSVA